MMHRSLVSVALISQALLVAAFQYVSPEEAWETISPGWNLGNTLDAIPNEGSWNNAPVNASTFDDIKAAGFKSVRLPVTWTHHFDSEEPPYNVSRAWMDRVEQVVDFALERDFWVVLNVHHDSWEWADFSTGDLESKTAKLESLWWQIATRFSEKSEKLILESLNEPVGDTEEVANIYNDLNARFYNIVRSSGGHNAQRIVSLPSLRTNVQYGADWFKVPDNFTDWTYQVHLYSPWDFTSNSWGKTFWGSTEEKDTVTKEIALASTTLNGTKVLLGEFGTGGVGVIVEKAAAWLWYDHVVRAAREYGIAIQWWDNGNDHFDRTTQTWRDSTVKDIILAAAAGKINTIPENGNATIWLKEGEPIDSRNVYLWTNGNRIGAVTTTNGGALDSTQFTVTQEQGTTNARITFDKSYLSSLPTGLGSIGEFVIESSEGADIPIEVRRYTTPTITTTNFTAPTTDYALTIPVELNGARLATVKAIKADGSILKDDWTQYLGPLQQGRINWGDYEYASGNLVVSASLLTAIQNAKQAVTLTWEFWPRTDPTNNVVVTISY